MKAKMLMFKKLNIQPNGNITGGYFQYSFDDKQGVISYNGQLNYSFMWGTIRGSLPLNGEQAIDPNLLQSANVKVGEKLTFGPLQIDVMSISDQKANCNVTVQAGGAPASGVAILDLSAPEIVLLSLNAQGSFMGQVEHLVAS